MLNLIMTLAVGLAGGILALKLKVPAGAMVGAMLATGLFSVLTGHAYLPQNVRVVTQIAAGAFIGAGIRMKDIQDLKLMIKPAVLMVLSMIILDLLMGYIMYKTTKIDLVTSLFACAPAGIVDMSLISHDLGADSSRVALLQMVRLMTVFMLLPTIMKIISSHISTDKNESQSLGLEKADKKADSIKNNSKEKAVNLAITSFLALAAGGIGYISKIPAGAMTFSMVTVAALSILTNRGYMPLNIRRLTQVFAGVLIGERMTYGDVLALRVIIVPAFVLIIGIIIVNFCIGIFITKVGGLEIITSLLASAPGGVSDMALIAKDLGGDAPKVAILQLARYVCIIAIFPIIVKFII